MKNAKNYSSSLLPIISTFVLATIMMYPSLLSEKAWASDNRTITNDDYINSDLTRSLDLGRPIYSETYLAPSNESGSFTGNGTLMNMDVVVASGNTTFTSHKNNSVFIEGNAQLTTVDGNLTDVAPYTFQSLGYYDEEGKFSYKGVAFFDSTATGKLSMLSNVMDIFKGETMSDSNGKFAMWKLE